MAAPSKTLVAGEPDGVPTLTKAVYAAVGAADAVKADAGPADQLPQRAVAYLLEK